MTGGGDTSMALAALRGATRPLHDAVEATGAAARIMDGAVTRDAYRDFLIRTATAVAPLEGWLDGVAPSAGLGAVTAWGRVEALKSDIATLGGTIPAATSAIEIPAGRAAALGVLYVLEGSALGGAMIARHVQRVLGPDAEQFTRFHSGDGEKAPLRWRRLMPLLAELDGDAAAIRMAVAAAEVAFGLFLAAYDGRGEVRDWLADGKAALPPTHAAS